MFVGLFIVVTGLEMTVLTPETIAAVSRLDLETAPVLSVVTAGLSNLVSNVPAVLVLKPFIANCTRSTTGVARRRHGLDACRQFHSGRIGRQSDRRAARSARGVTIGFWSYFKVGAPLTLLTILFGAWWL